MMTRQYGRQHSVSQSQAVQNIESEVIHGHVVPDRLLFTMPSNPSKTEKTATYEVAAGEEGKEKDFPLVVVAIQQQGSNGGFVDTPNLRYLYSDKIQLWTQDSK